jgi:hypothetical protein
VSGMEKDGKLIEIGLPLVNARTRWREGHSNDMKMDNTRPLGPFQPLKRAQGDPEPSGL